MIAGRGPRTKIIRRLRIPTPDLRVTRGSNDCRRLGCGDYASVGTEHLETIVAGCSEPSVDIPSAGGDSADPCAGDTRCCGAWCRPPSISVCVTTPTDLVLVRLRILLIFSCSISRVWPCRTVCFARGLAPSLAPGRGGYAIGSAA
jgi:hypothetical protein